MISSLLTSAGLGIGAGINAYATLLVFGLLARWQPSMFHDQLARFFASTPVLIVVAVLYLIEFVADKIPTVDHIWDLIHTVIRPIAGALVAFAAVSNQIPHGAVIIAILLPWLVLVVLALVTLLVVRLCRRADNFSKS